MCIALSDAVEAVGRRHAEARAAVTRFDSVLTFGPPMGALRDYAGLVLARLYAELGDQRRALAAANRRAHMQEWPHYLAPQLRETARLSAAVGDTAGALRAYRHYLALRSEADPPLATEVEALRAELRRLEASTPEER